MKPTLQFRLSQHLTLTPQLQQSIRLLQLSTVELNQEIERLLLENPVLERDDEPEEGAEPRAPRETAPTPTTDSDEAVPETGAQDWSFESSTWQGGEDDEAAERSSFAADEPTLREHLYGQLSLLNLPERDRILVGLLIDALNDDGLLSQPLEEILALLPAEAQVDPEELAIALQHLQQFEPTGVGARTIRECLALQVQAAEADSQTRALAIMIIEQHLELLANRDYNRLRALTGADDDALRAAQALIRSVNPRPGASFARIAARYITPDVIVRKVRNVWRASLNSDAIPKLRINRLYAQLAAGARGQALGAQLQEARWMIKNVRQRFDTILRVSQEIVDRQRNFFEHGEVAMRPLVLREVADALGLHESTVSRVTTQKYLDTPRGLLELKFFFGSHVATDSGGAASSTAIRALIKQLVGAENARAPLSDSRLSQILGEQGIVVARRTVAKYREALQIPPVSQRKAL